MVLACVHLGGLVCFRQLRAVGVGVEILIQQCSGDVGEYLTCANAVECNAVHGSLVWNSTT
jgi:hypothetical protein